MTAADLDRDFWETFAAACREAIERMPAPHPDVNFLRLAQRIAEEQAGLRERPASLTPLEEYGFDPNSS